MDNIYVKEERKLTGKIERELIKIRMKRVENKKEKIIRTNSKSYSTLRCCCTISVESNSVLFHE
jgi:hypothetical protein